MWVVLQRCLVCIIQTCNTQWCISMIQRKNFCWGKLKMKWVTATFAQNTRYPNDVVNLTRLPDSKVCGANMGHIWGWQDPSGSHVGPMNLAIWAGYIYIYSKCHMIAKTTKQMNMKWHIWISLNTYHVMIIFSLWQCNNAMWMHFWHDTVNYTEHSDI